MPPGPFYLGLDIPFNECESTVFRADEYPPLPSPPRITLRPSDTWGGWHQFALLRSLDLCVKTVDAQPSSPPPLLTRPLATDYPRLWP